MNSFIAMKRNSKSKQKSTHLSSSSGRTRTKDKYRVVYSDHQRLELEKEFHYSRYITIRRKAELAQGLGLSERQVGSNLYNSCPWHCTNASIPIVSNVFPYNPAWLPQLYLLTPLYSLTWLTEEVLKANFGKRERALLLISVRAVPWCECYACKSLVLSYLLPSIFFPFVRIVESNHEGSQSRVNLFAITSRKPSLYPPSHA